MVAQCSLVPSTQGNVDIFNITNPMGGCSTGNRKCKRPAEQESTVVIDSMDNKGRRRDIPQEPYDSLWPNALLPTDFSQKLDKRWGPQQVDLFASHKNRKLERILHQIQEEKIQATLITPTMRGSMMVPDSQSVIKMRSSYNSAEQSLSRGQSLRQRARPEPKLGSKCVEYRRNTLLAVGASEDVISLIFDAPSVIHRNKSYEQVQLQFEKFTADSGRDPNTPDSISVMNFLAHGYFQLGWASTTVFKYKSKILQLYDDSLLITSHAGYSSFMDAVAAAGVNRIRSIDVDLSPVFQYFIRLGDNSKMTLLQLSQKLCWLLGTCGLMRPDDIRCIDVSKSNVTEGNLNLEVVFPKERRGKRKIIKTIKVWHHSVSELCPVKTYSTYRLLTSSYDKPTVHPKHDNEPIVPLTRNCNDLSFHISSDRISDHTEAESARSELGQDSKVQGSSDRSNDGIEERCFGG
ncbi:hypothetical protein BGZ49_010201 [Haplosporangium sp. Z 27]|nr:hypothetical protein BGZ49_010201 [Haplosporangium sp. Z 27]